MASVPTWPTVNTVMSYKPSKQLHRALVVTRVAHCHHIISVGKNHADPAEAKRLANVELAGKVARHAKHKAKS